MTRRRAMLLAACALAGVAVAVWAARPAPRPRLRAENFPLVRVGMTRPEVEALLGGPPGDYGRNTGGAGATAEGFITPPGSVEEVWRDDGNQLMVWFDAGGRAVKRAKRAGYRQFP